MSLTVENPTQPAKWHGSDPWKEVKDAPGAYPVSPSYSMHVPEQHTIAAAVRARRSEYIGKRDIKIKVGTWNVGSISGTEKDLAGWFIHGLGVKGLSQDLSGLSLGDDTDSSDENVESIEDQEARATKKKSTLPKNETPAIPSEDNIGLYVLGLQEVVDISSVTEAMRPFYDPNPAKKWKRALKRSLPSGYVKIAELQLLGLLILVYAAPDIAPQITSVDTVSVGTGALGYMGNKGSTSVRIVLGGTTRILFVNCHLAAGADQTSLTRRIWDTNKILSGTKFEPAVLDGDVARLDHESIGDEDVAFWFGDLNYRLDDIPGEDVRRLLLLHTRNEYDVMNKSRRKIDSELGYIDADPGDSTTDESFDDRVIEGGNPAIMSSANPPLDPVNDPASLYTTIKSLLVHDQLKAQQKLRKAFHEGWREGDIGFLPTYKYDVGSVGMYDSGEKKRAPSWCDRILYRTRHDKEEYEERVRQEIEAHRRDEDMKARGLVESATDQDILFDYNPEVDGTDDYDEYDDAEEALPDSHSQRTTENRDDMIHLDDYISHQRVLSSDHKPLSAVFTLTYDSVLPELKNKIQQEVTREFDKTENEGRPSVTVVVEHPSGGTAHADRPIGASELKDVEFNQVRYHVPATHVVTVANTSPMPATIAFIARPGEEDGIVGSAPSWLSIHVQQESLPNPIENDELGTSTRFMLYPGDTVTINLTMDLVDAELVQHLNEGTKTLDEILILRVLNGRDHFIRVTGTWLGSCFYQTLDQLARVPAGIRNLHAEARSNSTKLSQLDSSTPAYHSAPTELFMLTEAIPGLVERTVVDWTMVREGEEPPWIKNALWPFQDPSKEHQSDEQWQESLGLVREAMDTASTIDDYIDPTTSVLRRLELLTETLVSFLHSLRSGVVEDSAWTFIEERLVASEKTNLSLGNTEIQDIVMEAMSSAPVHSVSFTFLTFMLSRIITELSSSETPDPVQLPQTPTHTRRMTSSSEASETTSELSLASTESPRSKFAFLPSLTNRRSRMETETAAASLATTQPPVDQRSRYVKAYAEKFASIIIRSDLEKKLKGKEKKAFDARRRRVLEVFLDNGLL